MGSDLCGRGGRIRKAGRGCILSSGRGRLGDRGLAWRKVVQVSKITRGRCARLSKAEGIGAAELREELTARYFGSVETARRREHRCLVCLEYVSKGLWQIGLKVQEVTFRLDPSFFPWDNVVARREQGSEGEEKNSLASTSKGEHIPSSLLYRYKEFGRCQRRISQFSSGSSSEGSEFGLLRSIPVRAPLEVGGDCLRLLNPSRPKGLGALAISLRVEDLLDDPHESDKKDETIVDAFGDAVEAGIYRLTRNE
ncbi:hypothetical protein HAX54_022075 [Datura stramonium]|uniref:Uncharacterized protein n=1 Tax=Datura stramonium TaxID=4076 RepID=A0ABS8UW31_DATST|nr:hypothetical protein [Datura stramonium]